MALSRGFRSGRVHSVARKSSWEVGPQLTLSSISASGSTLGTAAISPTTAGLTLVRTRGELLLFLSSAAAAIDGFAGAFGIGLATLAAVTAGAASVPTPVTEAAWDGWLYHRFFHLFAAGIIDNSVAADTDAMNATTAVLRLEVDSKAMRKLADSTVAVYMALEVTETGTAALRAAFDSRVLVKLS